MVLTLFFDDQLLGPVFGARKELDFIAELILQAIRKSLTVMGTELGKIIKKIIRIR